MPKISQEAFEADEKMTKGQGPLRKWAGSPAHHFFEQRCYSSALAVCDSSLYRFINKLTL